MGGFGGKFMLMLLAGFMHMPLVSFIIVFFGGAGRVLVCGTQ
jgi:hypothetical protein